MSAPITVADARLALKQLRLECFDAAKGRNKAETERDQLRAELATCKDASESLIESLRAEVKRLRECCDQTSALCGKFITEDDGTDLIPNSARIANALARLATRAERAEADADSTRERALTLANSLDEAQAELAELKESVLVQQIFSDDRIRANEAEAELADIRALANRRNKRDHSQDTTHQLVAALDQALDIAQAELAATKSTLDEEVNCAEKAEHEVVRQYARAERAEADLAAERAKVRVLSSACESICEEWGRNHDAPFCAGSEMEKRASRALEKLEGAT